MATEHEFSQLTERLQRGREKLAVLKAREQEKAQERNELMTELKGAGIDLENLEGERERLEKEIQADYDKAEALVSDFEQKLEQVGRKEGTPVELAQQNFRPDTRLVQEPVRAPVVAVEAPEDSDLEIT
jgi:chromosome segregation ATPase